MARRLVESLKAKLGLGAALLGVGTILTAGILYVGMTEVAQRLDAALASENRIARYSALSTQTSTFLVIATEMIQTGQSHEIRSDRILPIVNQIRDTFSLLHADLEVAVDQARELGIDEQSRHGTQSLGLARMEAMLNSTMRGLTASTEDQARLRAYIDTFATSVDPLLNQAVNAEVLFRNNILSGIEELRRSLSRIAIVIGILSLLILLGFYLGLIRPQFLRLDRLREAARQISQENFAVALPISRSDEIGQLYQETNRMALALSERQNVIRAEWARLNETIEQRTEELRAANATLEKIDENRRRFFADVSHELRTPLTVILMEAQLGQQEGSDTQAAFATISARAARLNRRIDDLLRVARSDTGRLALEPAKVCLDVIARDVVEEIQAEVDNAGMQLETVAMPDVALHCDANWLRQVIVGLVRNAIRHARNGAKLRLAPDQANGLFGLSVTDNGPGIAPDDQNRVFDRFSQGGQPNAQGFGIGLALAKWVTEAQGGEISLQSPVEADEAIGTAPGTKISVRLPLVAP
nr:HAMP domain-containing sensor histidine kinase [Roseovarius aestuariivivens]